jgi:hypothetical protein
MSHRLPAIVPLSIALAFALLAPAACARDAHELKPAELSLDEVEKRLHDPGFFVFDNNSRETFARGHVPGAKWVDYSRVSAADLPSDKTATLVFYCANEH